MHCQKKTSSILPRSREQLAIETESALCTNSLSTRQVFVSEAMSVGGGRGH